MNTNDQSTRAGDGKTQPVPASHGLTEEWIEKAWLEASPSSGWLRDQIIAFARAVQAEVSAPPEDERDAFEAWAPTVHMRTERWAVNPELYDDEDAISAWQGWQARASLSRSQAQAVKAARAALKEAELLLHRIYTEHGLALVDDGDGTWVSVSNAADRMDAAIDAIDAAAMPAVPDRDEAIRVWHRHCDKFSHALGDHPPSVVIDAMLTFAALGFPAPATVAGQWAGDPSTQDQASTVAPAEGSQP